MVDYPDLSSLTNASNIGNIMALPNSSYPYFWAWIIAGIWIIIVTTLYFKERERKASGNLLSSMAVACLAIIFLSVIGSILGIVTIEIMIYILVISLVIIGIWVFSES